MKRSCQQLEVQSASNNHRQSKSRHKSPSNIKNLTNPPLQTKPAFLVLPCDSSNTKNIMGLTLVNHSNSDNDNSNSQTWPLSKVKQRTRTKSLERRPRTATLNKPRLLNESLINVLDMSLITKELLQITNLCQTHISHEIEKKRHEVKHAFKPVLKTIIKRVKKEPKASQAILVTSPISKPTTPRKSKDLDNNRRNLKTLNNSKTFTKLSDIENNIEGGFDESLTVPVPCKTCGRTDQPERFHSHPITPRSSKIPYHPKCKSPSIDSKTKVLLRINNQQKPSHSKSTRSDRSVKSDGHIGMKSKSPYLTTLNFNKVQTNGIRPSSTPRKPKAETCYLCGNEFGAASLPLHETKCLERWETENAKLPLHMQRKAPPGPKNNGWTETVWAEKGKTSKQNGWVSTDRGPLTVECYICGRKFGSLSISIHERQCLKKWHAQNNLLPLHERLKLPAMQPNQHSTPNLINESPESTGSKTFRRPLSSKSRPTTPSFQTIKNHQEKAIKSSKTGTNRAIACYLCGRAYFPSSLKFHEPECLQKWILENEKLPLSQRRNVPQKPDIIYTEKNEIDIQATNDDSWKLHLNQLVPCRKCSRTFFPERISVHEPTCKGKN